MYFVFMITVSQIKAARALLDWNQRDLVAASGLSLTTIAQIESGAGNPRASTMQLLQKTLEKHSVEFTDEPGVRMQRETFAVNVWQGREAILKIWSDIESTLMGEKEPEVLLSSLDDSLWEKLYPKELPLMLKNRKNLNIKTRALIKSAKDNHTLPMLHCRIVPKTVFANSPYYVYRDKVAIIKMKSPIRVILIKNETVAESYRGQFLWHWQNGENS